MSEEQSKVLKEFTVHTPQELAAFRIAAQIENQDINYRMQIKGAEASSYTDRMADTIRMKDRNIDSQYPVRVRLIAGEFDDPDESQQPLIDALSNNATKIAPQLAELGDALHGIKFYQGTLTLQYMHPPGSSLEPKWAVDDQVKKVAQQLRADFPGLKVETLTMRSEHER